MPQSPGPQLPAGAAVAWRDATERRRAKQTALLGRGRLDDGDRRAGLDRLALLDGERLDQAGLVGRDLVLHLHRLDDADELALLDGLALLDEHLPHVALQRREQLVGAAAAAGLALSALGRGAPWRGRCGPVHAT